VTDLAVKHISAIFCVCRNLFVEKSFIYYQ